MDAFILELQHKVKAIEELLASHISDHPLDHHDHLMDEEEHAAHHARMDKPKEQRQGERRGPDRRTGSEAYSGEERRSA
jgi:hypothetical protein